MRGDLPRKSLTSKKRKKATFHSPSDEWVFPAASTIQPEERRFWSKHAHGQHESHQLCRIGKRKGLGKSDDGCCTEQRGANKRRGNSVCQRIELILNLLHGPADSENPYKNDDDVDVQ